MKYMTLKLTLEELKLLATMASDQLFRKEFIDPKMPGYRPNGDLNLVKSLVGRLRVLVDQGSPKRTQKTPARGAGWRSEQASGNGSTPSARAAGTIEEPAARRRRASKENA